MQKKYIISFIIIFVISGLFGFFLGRKSVNPVVYGSGENSALADAYGKQYQELVGYRKAIAEYKKTIDDHVRIEQSLKAERDKYKRYILENEKANREISVSLEIGSSANEQIRLDSMEAIRIIESLDK